MSFALLTGDCRARLPELEAEIFDACVTDPPYHLKGTNGAAANCASPNARQRGKKGFMGMKWDGGDVAFRPETWAAVLRTLKPGAHLVAFGGTRTYHRMACAVEDAGFEIRDMLGWLYGSGWPKSANQEGEWEGWGTALKPALEPVVFARKPFTGTIPAQLAAHGTGALNIDACRVPLDPSDPLQDGITGRDGLATDTAERDGAGFGFKSVDRAPGLGRWPANVLHDGSPEVLEVFPAEAGAVSPVKGTERSSAVGNSGHVYRHRERAAGAFHGDRGSAARFFYCAKASPSDRSEGNVHPTVKPNALMRYLVRLITPPGGHVLDPFAGSGSTLLAALQEGFSVTGIELEEPYAETANRPAPLLWLHPSPAMSSKIDVLWVAGTDQIGSRPPRVCFMGDSRTWTTTLALGRRKRLEREREARHYRRHLTEWRAMLFQLWGPKPCIPSIRTTRPRYCSLRRWEFLTRK